MTFEKLPEAVSSLLDEIQEIKRLLLSQSKPQVDDQETFWSLSQAANFLELSHPTVYGLVSRKEIPVSKRGNRLYFSKQELTEWIKMGRKKTKEETASDADAHFAAICERKRKVYGN